MRGWMGGKRARRRVDVSRRDPVARQRQYFARRREFVQRLNFDEEGTGNVVNAIDCFRHTPQLSGSPLRRHVPPQRNVRPKRPQRVSEDFLMLAKPSDLDSLVPEFRNAKRARHVGPKQRGIRRNKTSSIQIHHNLNTNELDECEPEEYESDVQSRSIRIFDADEEKTPQFRKKTLPSTFLNSEVGNRHYSPYFKPSSPSRHEFVRMLSRGEKKLPHRDSEFHANISTTRSDGLAMRDSPLKKRTGKDLIQHSSHTKSFVDIFAEDENQKQSRFGLPVNKSAELSKFEISEKPDQVQGGQTPSFSNEGSRSVRSRHGNDHVDMMMLGKIRRTDMKDVFPPMNAICDSEHSSPTLSEKKAECKEFCSLLTLEDVNSDDFRAEVVELEMSLLNEPDTDVCRFSNSRKKRRHDADATCCVSKLQMEIEGNVETVCSGNLRLSDDASREGADEVMKDTPELGQECAVSDVEIKVVSGCWNPISGIMGKGNASGD